MEQVAETITLRDLDHRVERLRINAAALRRAQDQSETVSQIVRWSEEWFTKNSTFRSRAERIGGQFPYGIVKESLDALLRSLSQVALLDLIQSEQVDGAMGPPAIGHVIASNTPLLAWTSVLRALIVESSSLVKVSARDDSCWTVLLKETLQEINPALGNCVEICKWSSADADLNRRLCSSVDLILAYGSDSALDALRKITPSHVPFLGYGHRISIGVASDAIAESDIKGFARDILVYDQGGCLSPQIIFVRGNAAAFAERLAQQLEVTGSEIPFAGRGADVGEQVRTFRALARMAGSVVIGDIDLRWTVVVPSDRQALPPGRNGTVFVHSVVNWEEIPSYVAPYLEKLQGCALAPWPWDRNDTVLEDLLDKLRFTRICGSGELQLPPITWRQDNYDVLGSLVRLESSLDLVLAI